MDVYLYRAALYCTDCGESIKAHLHYAKEGMSEYDYDSDDYPKGPFLDGGGEADCPNHCDACGIFLENPLTGDGAEYVMAALRENTGNQSVLAEWREFYSYLRED